MNCPDCNKPIDDDALTCPECGYRLKDCMDTGDTADMEDHAPVNGDDEEALEEAWGIMKYILSEAQKKMSRLRIMN